MEAQLCLIDSREPMRFVLAPHTSTADNLKQHYLLTPSGSLIITKMWLTYSKYSGDFHYEVFVFIGFKGELKIHTELMEREKAQLPFSHAGVWFGVLQCVQSEK